MPEQVDPNTPIDPNTPTKDPESAPPTEGDTTTLKVYGKDTVIRASVAGDEAARFVELAQKGAASDQRWTEAQEVAAKGKEDVERAAEALQVLEAIQTLREHPEDAAAYEKLATAMGYDQEAMNEISERARGPAASGNPKEPTAAPRPAKPPTEQQKWDLLPKDAQAELKQVFRNRMDGDLKVALAKDPVIRENEGNESRMAAITEMAAEEATRLMVVGEPDPASGRNRPLAYGPEVVRRAVEKARQRIESLGIQAGTTDQLPSPGVGRAPAGGTARHPAQKPKRVPMTDPNYDRYFNERLQYEALRGD